MSQVFESKIGFKVERSLHNMAQKMLDPIHPGEILLEEFMRPMAVSINQLARNIGVPPGRISAIVNGNAPLPLIRLFAWPNTSARLLSFGLGFRVSMISESSNVRSDRKSGSAFSSTWPNGGFQTCLNCVERFLWVHKPFCQATSVMNYNYLK